MKKRHNPGVIPKSDNNLFPDVPVFSNPKFRKATDEQLWFNGGRGARLFFEIFCWSQFVLGILFLIPTLGVSVIWMWLWGSIANYFSSIGLEIRARRRANADSGIVIRDGARFNTNS